MTRYYTRTFVGMGIVLLALAIAAVVSNRAAADAKNRYASLVEQDRGGTAQRRAQRTRIATLEQAFAPVQEFATAWRPFVRLPEKGTAEHVRSELEAIAQRQLALVTDNAITPQPEKVSFQGVPWPVQRVTLRASGKDLVALLTWLGKVEEKYPAALVELCEFSSNVGGSTGLTLRLVQPLADASPRRVIAIPEAALAPEAMAALAWPRYTPGRLKSPVAVGFPRNPLQPAIVPEHQPIPLRDGADEITPKLEVALDGRLRSVVRGAAPIIVVDGRVFRTGDELLIGQAHERPVPDAKTKLKEIREDRLIFHVAGGTVDKPVQCDVAYLLPEFLRAR